ncbi:17233_t:CDS:2, partial [Dentiscutata erythropus]
MLRNRYVSFKSRKNYIRRQLNERDTGISIYNNCSKLTLDNNMLRIEDPDNMLNKEGSNYDVLVKDNSDDDMLYEDDMLSEDDILSEDRNDILSKDEDMSSEDKDISSKDEDMSSEDEDMSSKDEDNMLIGDMSNDVLSKDDSDREIVDEPLNNEKMLFIDEEF